MRFTSTDIRYSLEILESQVISIGGELTYFSDNPTGNERHWSINLKIPSCDLPFYSTTFGARETYRVLRALRWAIYATQQATER